MISTSLLPQLRAIWYCVDAEQDNETVINRHNILPLVAAHHQNGLAASGLWAVINDHAGDFDVEDTFFADTIDAAWGDAYASTFKPGEISAEAYCWAETVGLTPEQFCDTGYRLAMALGLLADANHSVAPTYWLVHYAQNHTPLMAVQAMMTKHSHR